MPVHKMPETAVDCRLLTLAHRKITRKKSGRSPGSRVNKQMACLPDPLPMRWHSGDGSGFDSFTVARAASEWRGLMNKPVRTDFPFKPANRSLQAT